MIKRKSQILILWCFFWDQTLTGLAWVSAYYLRFHSGFFEVLKETPEVSQCLNNVPHVLLVSAVAYRLTGQYAIHRFRRLREEFASVFKGVALMGLFVVATTFGLQDRYESRATFLIFFGLAMMLILTARRLTWAAVRWLRSRGYNQTQAIIVGTGRVARKAARSLRLTSWLGIKNIGFVEDQPTRWTSDLDILGTPADLPRLIEKYQVSHVFICLPMNRYHEARKVYDILSQTLADVRLIADVPELAGLSLTTTNFDGMPMIGLRESPHFGFNKVVKRAMDMMLSALALVVLTPVMALIAALIKITSPGPVLYAQERCGLNGQSFQMLKFRSMAADAEKHSGAVWAAKNDPRRTRL
ncbi:MAG TPA: sugar transferase, partial [Gemmataceae bacterium]|nr:sugar transferase [Gemmataceae bacterium]